MDRLRKFWSLTRREKLFLFEACILLLLSKLSVNTVAFKHIDSFLRAHWNDQRVRIDRPDNIKNDIKHINLSLSRGANVLPWNSLCLCRSIAGLIMLRRRGIPAVLIAGVKSLEDSSLHAHAWIRAGDGVVDWSSDGSSDNSAFTVVLRIGHESFLVRPTMSLD
jgi:hypothetical protein